MSERSDLFSHEIDATHSITSPFVGRSANDLSAEARRAKAEVSRVGGRCRNRPHPIRLRCATPDRPPHKGGVIYLADEKRKGKNRPDRPIRSLNCCRLLKHEPFKCGGKSVGDPKNLALSKRARGRPTDSFGGGGTNLSHGSGCQRRKANAPDKIVPGIDGGTHGMEEEIIAYANRCGLSVRWMARISSRTLVPLLR